eukprot:TRINITY_DN32980_c0_g1_i2.p1 TRINITY_DN32980_c0_g1~~TRINITY_DN32980_c0_g1_i2.p1  ORF type:complete len:915 (-),score=258.58 TRINITY_DN32980_c0_g1_i2:163-2907(-)
MMCCLDKQGLIATPVPYLEKLLLPVEYTDNTGVHDMVILDVEQNTTSTSRKVRFEDTRWRAEHLTSLKPIGLICLLVNDCQLHKFSKNETPMAAFCDERCLHYLSKEIGFSADVVLGWETVARVTVERPVAGDHSNTLGSLKAAVAKEKFNQDWICDGNPMQVLMSGHPLITLEYCTHYFDPDGGKEPHQVIRKLTADDRARIVGRYQDWREVQGHHCTAFAYRPLVEVEDPDLFENLPNSHVRIVDERVATGEVHPGTADSSETAVFESKLQGSIFLGMTAMRLQAKKSSIDMIDDLRKAGIRFIHFCPDPMRRAITFADKLGLDADWNCCISLRDPRPEDKIVEAILTVQKGEEAELQGCTEQDKSCLSEALASLAGVPLEQVLVEDGGALNAPRSPEQHGTESDKRVVAQNGKLTTLRLQLPKPEQSGIDKLTEALRAGHAIGGLTIKRVYWSSPSQLVAPNPNPAKLPVGISAVRDHLATTDNVPLLVNLFAEAGANETLEMIRIMQENGESVLCVGSSLHAANAPIFAQADFAISMEPSHPSISMDRRCEEVRNNTAQQRTKPWPPTFVSRCPAHKVNFAAQLSTLSCEFGVSEKRGLSEDKEINHCIWVSVISQSRRLHTNMLQATFFVLGANLSLALLALLVNVCRLPSLVTVVHVFWFSWLVIPALGFSLLLTPQNEDNMKVIASKNILAEDPDPKWADATLTTKHLVLYFLARFVPSVVLTSFLYAWCLRDSFNKSWAGIFEDDFFNDMSDELSGAGLEQLQWARGVALWGFLLYLCVLSAGFVHRLNPMFVVLSLKRGDDDPKLKRKFEPHGSWWVVVVASLVLQAVTAVFASLMVTNGEDIIRRFSWKVALVGLLWPFVTMVVDNMIKKHDGKQFVARKSWLMLDFNTKLGMHSPVANYERGN